MSNNLGPGVSYVFENDGYNYNEVVFQKGKPPLDSELNALQEIQNLIGQRSLSNYSSGWLTAYPVHTDKNLANQFYTQDPAFLKPEYALVNGYPVHFSKTHSETENENIIDLDKPPSLPGSAIVQGVFLETWKVDLNPSATVLDPDRNKNKPDAAAVSDSFNDIFMSGMNSGWLCGQNGILLKFNGSDWNAQDSLTTYNLNSIYFVKSTITESYIGTGWVVGDNGFIAYTTSGGNRWIVSETGISENLHSVCSLGDTAHPNSALNKVWAVGDGGVILKATNGITFTTQTPAVTTVNLNHVFFLNDGQTGWIVGDKGTLLKTTSAGTSWLVKSTGTTENLKSIYFYNGLFGFAVGDNGTILYSADGGVHWSLRSTTSEDINDITMVPTLDRLVTEEEVTSQFLVPGTLTFRTEHYPITKGDGNATRANSPLYLPYTGGIVVDGTYSGVTVDGTCVAVSSVNIPMDGCITLDATPTPGKTVKVSYYYGTSCAVFNGEAWAVGTKGTIFYTSDLGQTWTQQALIELPDSTVMYDFHAASFIGKPWRKSTGEVVPVINQGTGWLCGENSVIGKTDSSGSAWAVQGSGLNPLSLQRVYYEGNRDTLSYPYEDTIHPHANKETARRVQVQYRIRTEEADPVNTPEAGLSSAVLGRGPNDEPGIFPYENMGTINGDYGCWRAQCPNTVDGYCYAIPMFFVSRRNSAHYNAHTNQSGSHNTDSPTSIRPDLLVATEIVDQDILDVRRKIIVPDLNELLFKTFDQLSSNTLATNFVAGGGGYGTRLLQTDRIGGIDADGGTPITTDTSSAAVGMVSSEMEFILKTWPVDAPTTPPPTTASLPILSTGYYHPNPACYSAIYSGGKYDGHSVPGYFSGIGTQSALFTFNKNAITTTEDAGLSQYILFGMALQNSSYALTKVPSEPLLSKNYNKSSPDDVLYYQGVFSDASRIVESWDSGVAGYTNYVVAFNCPDTTATIEQSYRASPVELHSFLKVSASEGTLVDGNLVIKKLPPVTSPDSAAFQYDIYTIRKIKNIAGVTHHIQDINVTPSSVIVTPLAEYEFIEGMILEVISEIKGESTTFRNGAVITLTHRLRKINNFTRSLIIDNILITNAGQVGEADIFIPNTEIIGCSTCDLANLNQNFCWVTNHSPNIIPVVITGLGTDTISVFTDSGVINEHITIQLLIKENVLTYDSLLINYNYVPSQCQTLPSSLIVEPVLVPPDLFVSNLGPTGGDAGEPYELPLEHIAINYSLINDTEFCNKVYLQFANMLISSGFAQVPTTIPGNFIGQSLTFSGVSIDLNSRSFYTQCSQEMFFTAEGLQLAVPRKVYLPVIVKVKNSSSIFIADEYLMTIFSRTILTDRENKTGIFANGNCAVSVYRLANRPIKK